MIPSLCNLWQIVAYLACAAAAYAVYCLVAFVYAEAKSTARLLPGPPSSSLIYGNMKEAWDPENSVSTHEEWAAKYGPTINYKFFANVAHIYTTDTKAINHILMNPDTYQKPEIQRYFARRLVGEGVVTIEGEKHKQQRKVMNPAFGAAEIREITSVFVEKSLQLRDIWTSPTAKDADGSVDVTSWLSRMTLDVIGLAGFNYHFNALTSDPESNDLNKAFNVVFGENTKLSLVAILRAMFPALRWLRADRDAETDAARQKMDQIGIQLIQDSKAAILAEHCGKVDKRSWQQRDLLSVLLKSNMSTDIPVNQRMSDEDILAQVPTFLVAGHETSSTATTWALYALSLAPDVQKKLRREVSSFHTDNPTMDDLNSLPYLGAVVRETLRLHSPAPTALRTAVKDDVLPLSNPVKTRSGELLEYIQIKKGQALTIPILAMNRDRSIWGQDALEFKPERWEKTPESASSIPGVWGNMLTFLGGPRSCIGYRFALVEMKALLFTLIRAFEFELAVPPENIGTRTGIGLQRLVVRTDPQGKHRLPLIVRPVPKGEE